MTSLLDLTKTPILLWKHPTITSCFTLKIGQEQQLIGFIRTDKNGVIYWKFQAWSSKEERELSVIDKFQLRPPKARKHEPIN